MWETVFLLLFFNKRRQPDVFCFSSNIHMGRGTVSLISPTVSLHEDAKATSSVYLNESDAVKLPGHG